MNSSLDAVGGHRNPGPLLAIFSLLNVLIYLDRGAMSSNGINADGIDRDFRDMSLFREGVLPSAFMVGLLVSSPIFASLAASRKNSPLRLIGYGLIVWALSVFACGLTVGFWSLMICRMTVGVGEASFVALASPFIDDAAPRNRKTLYLAMFYACIPVGYALGFLYGGTVAVAVGWRTAFMLESVFMLPFILYVFITENNVHQEGSNHLDDDDSNQPTPRHHTPMADFMKETARGGHMTFLLVTLALTCYTGVIGSYAYFGPKRPRISSACPLKLLMSLLVP
jgi:MFS family permease